MTVGSTATETRRIQLGHEALTHVDVVVRRSARSRHVRIHVDDGGTVIVSAPARLGVHHIDSIVVERAGWLVEVLQRTESVRRGAEIDVLAGDPVRWLGGWRSTSVTRGSRRSRVRLEEDIVHIDLRDDDDPWQILISWYRTAARDEITGRVRAWCDQLSLEPGKISIRNQRTRWGSCTERGDLSFNWRLVLAPPWVLDAIVVHELCHLDELNHSDRFWRLLDQRYPRHTEASAWLREHGAALHVAPPRDPIDDAPPPARPRRGRQLTGHERSLFD